MSRILPAVLHGIISLTPQYIVSVHCCATDRLKGDFHTIAGFPNVIGAIDCTHIAIKAPSVNEINFVNRKGFYSVNVQVICDSHLALLNVVAKWPGGTHESFIAQNRSVDLNLQKGAVEDIGDRGYPLKTMADDSPHKPLKPTRCKVCYIVKACSVLHNITIKNGIPLNDPPRPDEPMPDGVFPTTHSSGTEDKS
ncbi:putative nuclease HARBI1 [Salmo salar]|uniref:Nuclease HARBI1 n=1 Tax=Salmo salar TaxID=8030 RepID=A0ABM3EJB1_SALSA|nr:putative nuclease HARBI1 [Salmo salar]